MNLSSAHAEAGTFSLPASVRLVGTYQVVNLVADDPSAQLSPSPRSAEDLRREGAFVRFSLPNEVQYLRLVQV